MRNEQAACWLVITMHRQHPRLVLMAFRILLTGLTVAPTMQVAS